MTAPANLIGVTVGNRTVLSRDGSRQGKAMWLCRCNECGQTSRAPSGDLRKGHGCMCRHGHGYASHKPGGKSYTYKIWCGMRRRCLHPSCHAYTHYGARGIRICDRWMDYDNFLADMGERPDGKSIDRIDNNGNYEPGNCRWATNKEQHANRRNNRRMTFNGRTMTMTEWANELGIHWGTILSRVRLGWSDTDALSRPVRKRKSL